MRKLIYTLLAAFLTIGLSACSDDNNKSSNKEQTNTNNDQNQEDQKQEDQKQEDQKQEDQKQEDQNQEDQNQEDQETYAKLPDVCTEPTTPVCTSKTTAYYCEPIYDEFILRELKCADHRICKNGACIPETPNKCSSNYCKDGNTLVKCNSDGTETEVFCGTDKLCADRQCMTATKVKTCSASMDCQKGEECHNGLCYKSEILNAKAWDECVISEFQEFCKNGAEYKCAYISKLKAETCADGKCDCSELAESAYTCKSNADCVYEGYSCYNGYCYYTDDLALKEGDVCDSTYYLPLCKDGVKYTCPDATYVQKNDCTTRNGCGTVLQLKAYTKDDVVVNALCLGSDDELKQCETPGEAYTSCFNYEDKEFDFMSIYYSNKSVCSKTTEGYTAFQIDREQTLCDSICNTETALCK